MAILNNALLSELTGQLGNMVIYKINGKTIIRRKPERKRPYKASKLQKFNQLAFKEVQQFLLPLKEILDFGFGEYSVGLKKGIHSAMSWAMKHAVNGEEDRVILEKTKVKVSQGDLPTVQNVTLFREAEDSVRISWDSAGSMGTARQTDYTWVVLYHWNEKKVLGIKEGSHRSKENQLIPLSGIFQEQGVLVFLSFYRKINGKKFRFSDSICLVLE